MPKNDFPVAPSDPTDSDDLVEQERRDAHVFWLLLLAVTTPSATFDERQRQRIRTHLATCVACRGKAAGLDRTLLAQLDVLDDADLASERATPTPWPTDTETKATLLSKRGWRSPGLAALEMGEEHSAIGQIPDEDVLDDYLAALISQRDDDTTNQLDPEVATHIAACATCQETIRALRVANEIEQEDAKYRPTNPQTPVVTPDPASQQSGWWSQITDVVRQLAQPFQIDVGRQTVAVFHELGQLLGDFTLAPTLQRHWLLRSAARVAEPEQAQSFMLDLRDTRPNSSESTEAAQTHRWAHVHVKLRAEFTRRLSGQLEYTWRQADDREEPAPNIRWTISRDQLGGQDDIAGASTASAAQTPLPVGMTDERGYSRFFLDDPGRYLLTTDIDHQRWIVPFIVAHPLERSASRSLEEPAQQESAQAEQITIGPLVEQPGEETPHEPPSPTNILSFVSVSADDLHNAGGSAWLPEITAQRPSIFLQGQRLTDYSSVDLTVERAASGGFGAVAMGPDRARGGRWVALKVFVAHSTGAARNELSLRLRTQFTRDSLGSIGLWPHPNLLRVNDVVEINAQPMLVLEYADQGNVRDLFARAQRRNTWLAVTTALWLAQQIAAGLCALHQPDPELMRPNPLVHGDFKPENILINSEGFALVSDMDSVRTLLSVAETVDGFAASGGASSDQAGGARHRVAGTPAYMPPEQWRDSTSIVPATDAYAFGILLCELLTGRHPLLDLRQRHSLDEWRQAHFERRPIPLRQLGNTLFELQRATVSGLDDALERIERLILSLLAKRPEQRPRAAEALQELQATAYALGEEPYAPPDVYPHTRAYECNFWLNWANAYARFGYYDEALPRIQRSLALAPSDPAVLSAYGGIMMGLRKGEEAIGAYRRALLALLPGEVQTRAVTLSQLADAQVAAGRYAEAAQTVREAAELDPTTSGLWGRCAILEELLAHIAAQAGRTTEAREHATQGLECVERALALSPDANPYREINQRLRQLRDAC